MDSCAMSIGEGHYDPRFRVNATLTFNNKSVARKYVLRTTLDPIEHWKNKINASKLPSTHPIVSPFTRLTRDKRPLMKQCAIVDRDLWVYGINGTIANDIFQAVTIGSRFFKVDAKDIIGDVYVKNLNIENEHDVTPEARIRANKSLYKQTCEAIKQAAKLLGVNTGSINFWIFSNSKNYKIPREDLHAALKEGGADEVKSSDEKIRTPVTTNNFDEELKVTNHLHLAKFYL